MPVKNGQIANLTDVMNALKKHNPFSKGMPDIRISVVLPTAYPNHREYLGKRNRAYIKDARTGRILITAPSTYEMVKKIEDGWIYEPNKREGLFITDGLLKKENDNAGKT